MSKDIHILHFNDVYQIEPTRNEDPVGGVSRFKTLISSFQQHNPLLLFSGDAFSPSTHSTITKGQHMVPVLNACNIACATLGNHDLDYGFEMAERLIKQCNFPWILSNVLDSTDNQPLLGMQKFLVLEHQGVKIGLIGLAEQEWIDTLAFTPENMVYLDFVDEGRRLASFLRYEQKCDLVIALTHMRQPNDDMCGQLCEDVDIVLGGHDHEFYINSFAGRVVLKSGSDFRHLSHLVVTIDTVQSCEEPAVGTNSSNSDHVPQGPWSFERTYTVDHQLYLRALHEIEEEPHFFSDQKTDLVPSADARLQRVRVWCEKLDTNRSLEEEPAMKALVSELTSSIDAAMDKVVGYTRTPLDASFEGARCKESNVGNLVTDIMRHFYESDIALFCGGGLRSNNIYPAGPVSLRTILLMFPYEDPCVVLRVSGQTLWDTLENAVSMYPKQDGRWCHASGCRYEFDPSREPGSRLTKVEVFRPIQLTRRISRLASIYPRSSAPSSPGIGRRLSQPHVPAGSQSLLDKSSLLAHHQPETGTWVPLDLQATFTLACRSYMYAGRDGFHALQSSDVLIDEEQGHIVSSLLRSYFTELKVLSKWQRFQSHDDSKEAHNEASVGKMKQLEVVVTRAAYRWKHRIDHAPQGVLDYIQEAHNAGLGCIGPAVEGRIVCLAASNS